MSETNASKRVRLNSRYISRDRNLYVPGVYQPHTLPAEVYLNTSLYDVLSDEAVVIQAPVNPLQNYNSDLRSEESKAAQEETTTHLQPTTTLVIEKNSFINETPAEINLMSRSELVALKGIGSKTADNIIKARELSPFLNMTDLSERVELPFSAKWSAYNLIFDVPAENA